MDPNNNPDNKDIYPDRYDEDEVIIYYTTDDEQVVYLRDDNDE